MCLLTYNNLLTRRTNVSFHLSYQMSCLYWWLASFFLNLKMSSLLLAVASFHQLLQPRLNLHEVITGTGAFVNLLGFSRKVGQDVQQVSENLPGCWQTHWSGTPAHEGAVSLWFLFYWLEEGPYVCVCVWIWAWRRRTRPEQNQNSAKCFYVKVTMKEAERNSKSQTNTAKHSINV